MQLCCGKPAIYAVNLKILVYNFNKTLFNLIETMVTKV